MTNPAPVDLDAIRARNARGVNRNDLHALVAEVERLRAERVLVDRYEYRAVSPAGIAWPAQFDVPPQVPEGCTVQRRTLGTWEAYTP